MASITTRSGDVLELSSLKRIRTAECKREASKYIEDKVPRHRRENILLWGAGYGITKENLGSFIQTVVTQCDNYETQISDALAHEAVNLIVFDFTSIVPVEGV